MAIPVARWTASSFDADFSQDLLVVAVDTPRTAIREQARQQVRQILREILAGLLNCSPAQVGLQTQPGQPPRVDGHPDIGLSISHEPGRSLLAINRSGPVGIDLLHIEAAPAWQSEIDGLACDYLGSTISGNTASERLHNFAQAWTAQEARLKCLALPLQESSPALQQKLAVCMTEALALDGDWIGCVARLKA